MVKLNKIYTRTGDQGTTGLGTGERVSKAHLRIAAYGTVDETNAAVGLAIAASSDKDNGLKTMLLRIQNDLFDLGADLCTPDKGEKLDYEPLRITPEQVARLEDEIDQLNERLEPLKSFVLPGGTALACHLHMARTICRRAERLMVDLAAIEEEQVSPPALKYINRLSDLLFVMSRIANDDGNKDILWQPGKNR